MPITIVGRRSSLFTRVALIVARELDVEVTLEVVKELTSLDPATYGDNPAMKMPTLRRADGTLLVGTENICRAIAESVGASARIAWPEAATTDADRNARELVAHAMAAQVQFAFGTIVCKLPADNVYFAKGRAGFEGALRWLDGHYASRTPDPTSLVDIELFCLVEHMTFRETLSPAPYPALVELARVFAERESAKQTVFRFD